MLKLVLSRALLACWVTFVAGATALAAGSSAIGFSAVTGEPIITYSQSHGMLRGLQERPELRVYGDGRVDVHVPAYRKGAGYYQYRLDKAQLDALLAQLDALGLLSFDVAATRAARDAAAAQRRAASGERFMTLDSTRTRIELNFAQLQRADKAGAELKQVIEWADIGIEAERYGQVQALTDLAAAERELQALIGHPARRAVKAPAGE